MYICVHMNSDIRVCVCMPYFIGLPDSATSGNIKKK